MPTLADELAEAEARVAQLRARISGANCTEAGHIWVSIGGGNACCILDRDCACSVPVHQCKRCKDCDYGDNPAADQVRLDCAARRGHDD